MQEDEDWYNHWGEPRKNAFSIFKKQVEKQRNK